MVVIGHMPLMLVNMKEGLGIIRHFLAKPWTNGVFNVVGRQLIGAED